MKIEDVLAVKAEGIKPESAYETQPYTYPSSKTFAFPSIWYSKERESLELAQGNRSTLYTLVEKSNSTTSASGQKPYYTMWYNSSMNNAEAWNSGEYHSMVMDPTQKAYWLSSRYVEPDSSAYCFFGLQLIGSDGVGNRYLYRCSNSSPDVNGDYNSVRPLVSIPLKNCEITENATTANTFDIVIK